MKTLRLDCNGCIANLLVVVCEKIKIGIWRIIVYE